MHSRQVSASCVRSRAGAASSTASSTASASPTLRLLEDGFADPVSHHPSRLAVFGLPDGSRVEFAVRNATTAHLATGPRVERHQLMISTPGRRRPRVELIQVADLRALVGAPEALRALELLEAGRREAAARYLSAAGPRWSALTALLQG